jgi:hypothetical protein
MYARTKTGAVPFSYSSSVLRTAGSARRRQSSAAAYFAEVQSWRFCEALFTVCDVLSVLHTHVLTLLFRSPKDAAVRSQRTTELFRELIAEQLQQKAAAATSASAAAATATATDSKAAPSSAPAPASASASAASAPASAVAASTSAAAQTPAAKLIAQSGVALTDNDKIIAINRAHILALRAITASDALHTVLSSERVYEDLTLAMEHKASWSQKLVVRAWVDIPLQYEFRGNSQCSAAQGRAGQGKRWTRLTNPLLGVSGFVYNNELTALCQYYHYCFFPSLVTNKGLVLSLVHEFFERIKNVVPLNPKEYVSALLCRWHRSTLPLTPGALLSGGRFRSGCGGASRVRHRTQSVRHVRRNGHIHRNV